MKNTVYQQVQSLFIILILCGFILTSCNQKKETETTSHSGVKTEQIDITLPAMYSGKLPCADCPNIRYRLIIEENKFTEISIYDNDPNARFEKIGDWEINGDTLSIFDSENSLIKRFLVNEKKLTLLDRENQEIKGDLSEMYVLERTGNQPSIREHHAKLADQGYTFYAGGNEPFWSLKIDSLNRLIFETPDSTRHFSDADSTKDGNTVVVKANSELGQITIQAGSNYCQDSMSGYLFPRQIKVIMQSAKQDTLTGCGTFLNS